MRPPARVTHAPSEARPVGSLPDIHRVARRPSQPITVRHLGQPDLPQPSEYWVSVRSAVTVLLELLIARPRSSSQMDV